MSALFSQTCEYAIRAMIEIARRPQGEFVLAKELASKLDIPHHYLSKILQQLVRSRILESTRGRLGGFRMLRKPGEVMLLDIVAPFEDIQKTQECILGEATCSDSRACPLHEFWKAVRTRYEEQLHTKSLEEFARFQPQGSRKREKARA